MKSSLGIPKVSVGILHGANIRFILNDCFLCNNHQISGCQSVQFKNGKILWNNNIYEELIFTPISLSSNFTLEEVTIGKNFHWEKNESQTFSGSLKLIVDSNEIYAINNIDIEDYLRCVISSEMSATSSVELLKAHAIISRSWLITQIKNRKHGTQKDKSVKDVSNISEGRIIKWYDREDHLLFDVCADDHCQRYQGIERQTNKYVNDAINLTKGMVLTYAGKICDARFSKCCGGITEEFKYCWDNLTYPYLTAVLDSKYIGKQRLPRLDNEEGAKEWILKSPDSFCNTQDKEILKQILNDYDQTTVDFYRWKVTYLQGELSDLIGRKLGVNIGDILDIIPLKRGASGRIYELMIKGSKRDIIIGKELEIRRVLSESHLYSSAFIVEKSDEPIPSHFTLIGAGWGHGVGLCQIGAAMMGAKGYSYLEILAHYYVGAEVTKLY